MVATHLPNKSAGFSVLEIMMATSVMVVGLLAVASATTTTQMMRKRTIDEDKIFRGMIARLETCRGELFRDTDFQDDVSEQIAADGTYEGAFILDLDGDGEQDVSASAGDSDTPVFAVTIRAPDPPGDPNVLLEVTVNASWYGVGGIRTRTVQGLVGNRTGFGD